jgi:hypothetical protein
MLARMEDWKAARIQSKILTKNEKLLTKNLIPN